MHARTTTCAALAAVGLLALPGVAAAASKSVYAGPLNVKGYTMNVFATDGGASDSLTFMLSKTAGKSTQTHNYAFATGVKVVVKGAKATIKGSLGRYGSVKLNLNAARKTRGIVPKGCTGKVGASRSGTAAGKLKLVADSTYFRTISAKRLAASIPGTANIKCQGSGDGGTGGNPSSGLTLSSFPDMPGGDVILSISKSGGSVLEMVSRMDAPEAIAPASSVSHMILARTGAAGLTAAADLTSASATAAGPFLTGSLQFTGEPMAGMSMGTLAGDFTAKFDSIGKLQLAAGGPDGTLLQR
jgi:hypothetical protein